MNDLLPHLWSSTLVLLIALSAAWLLPLTARTRYALLLCGLAKFAVPSAMFTAPLRGLGIDINRIGSRTGAIVPMEWLGSSRPLGTVSPGNGEGSNAGLFLIWLVPAAAFAITWTVTRQRLVSSVLRSATAASPRERSALAAARQRLAIPGHVDIVRSQVSSAPAVVGIIRPVIVLPDGECDVLDDAELESVLSHECAHIARRDNLLGLFESAIIGTFWFHPLVWIAQRAAATAREEACDETAASSSGGIATYVTALSKVCSTALAPPVRGVSCMANAYLKERLVHLMSYERLRARALSHHLVLTFAVAAVLSMTIISGVRAASAPAKARYELRPHVRLIEGEEKLDFGAVAIESVTGQGVMAQSIVFKRGTTAELRSEAEGRDISLEIRDLGEKVTVTMRVVERGKEVQRSTYTVPESEFGPPRSRRRFTGDPISLDYDNAEVKVVLDKFAEFTGLDIRYAQGVKGTVTMKVSEMPWDQAFDRILRENGLTYELNDNVMVIKPR